MDDLILDIDGLIDKIKHVKQDVGCWVNTVTREYNDRMEDLSVKVPGGRVTIERSYYGDKWSWKHVRNNLTFLLDRGEQSDGSSGSQEGAGTTLEFTGLDTLDYSQLHNIASIEKGGVIYERSGATSNSEDGEIVYTHHTYRIVQGSDGFVWFDKDGNWKEYDGQGRMISYGDRVGVLAKLIYQGEDASAHLAGISDRNDRQIFWFEYDNDGYNHLRVGPVGSRGDIHLRK